MRVAIGGRTGLIVQDSHLPEKIARVEPRENGALVLSEQAGDLNFAFEDEVKTVARISFLEMTGSHEGCAALPYTSEVDVLHALSRKRSIALS